MPEPKPVWNPLYVAYCRALGDLDPDGQVEADMAKWPGGCMTGFFLWISERKEEFRILRPDCFFDRGRGALTRYAEWYSFVIERGIQLATQREQSAAAEAADNTKGANDVH